MRSVAAIDRLLRPLRRAGGREQDLEDGRGGGGPEGVRLHLGCGDDYWPGWVNIDVSDTARCDLRLDFSRLGESFAEGTVAQIAMIHSLSYLRLWQARELLTELHRLLRPGGTLVVELPDLAKCAARALETAGDEEGYLEAVRGLYAFGMDQIARRDRFTPYAFGWSAWHLRRELERAGFRDVRVLDPRTHGPRPWRDSRVEATA